MLLFGKYILIVIVAVLMLCVLSYISVPVYDFQSGRSFCGDSVYNPYAGADSSCWRKANFHAHQKEKPQCDYTVEQMLEAYRSNGYDIMSISDHQCLNTEHADRPGFISTYEHGYGINGYHQLVMGAERVTWRDFPLMLTQSQMQYMLHWLRPQAEALVLNHPGKTRIIDLAVYGWLRVRSIGNQSGTGPRAFRAVLGYGAFGWDLFDPDRRRRRAQYPQPVVVVPALLHNGQYAVATPRGYYEVFEKRGRLCGIRSARR